MPFPISCKIISLFLFIFHTCANELNIFEPGTQVDTILSQDNLAVSAGSTTATFDGITDNALQQNDQHPSNPNPLLLASENPDCAASSSNIMQSPAGRRSFRMRSKRDGDSTGGEACEWQEFKDDGLGTTTPDDEQFRGKRRRPKPGTTVPGRKLGPVGPLKNPEPITNPEPAPYKLDRDPDPQKCPFGGQNIPVCYPKVAPSPTNPALFLSPCRTDEPADPCDPELEDLWCCREVYMRVIPKIALIPPNMRPPEIAYDLRYPNSASFCIGVLNPPKPPYPIWLWP